MKDNVFVRTRFCLHPQYFFSLFLFLYFHCHWLWETLTFLQVESVLLLNAVFICICIQSELQHDQAGYSVLKLVCIGEGNDDVTGINACVPFSGTICSDLDPSCSDTGKSSVLKIQRERHRRQCRRYLNSNSWACKQL